VHQEGLIRMLGISNVSVERLETAMRIADIVWVQNRYNLADRKSQPVLDRCEELGIAFIPWAPIETGEVEGSAVERVAEKYDATPVQIALAWLLAVSDVTVPIPGTSSIEHLEENVAASAIELDEEDLAALA
jgi:aryl-alcohol dehydrogenase-like predicted oxidoreductase